MAAQVDLSITPAQKANNNIKFDFLVIFGLLLREVKIKRSCVFFVTEWGSSSLVFRP
jgi:hypothetical protein